METKNTIKNPLFLNWLKEEYDSVPEELGDNNLKLVIEEFEELSHILTSEEKDTIYENTIRSLNL